MESDLNHGHRLADYIPGCEMSRLRVYRLAVFFLFLVIIGRLFHLQVFRHEFYRKMALRNFIRTVRIQAPRGRIMDRNGIVLANWIPAFRLHFLYDSISTKTIDVISSIVGRDKVEKVISMAKKGIVQPLDLDFEDAQRIEERMDLLPGVVITGIPRRYYPEGSVFSHLIGYTGEADIDDIRSKLGYKPGDILGKTGLEKALEDTLRGKPGVRFLAIDASGKLVSMDPRPPIPPVPGKDVMLTVDYPLQKFIDSLARPLGRGAIVALDAKNAEILALYSFPTFDPNQLSWGISKELWQEITSDKRRPLVNRAISGLYPPGSLIKPLIGLIGLRRNKITRWSKFSPCVGVFTYGSRKWRCWNPSGHGALDIVHAIEQSCDVYFYQLGLSLGLKGLLMALGDALRVTRVELHLPGERHSFIPTIEWYEKRYGRGGYGPGVVLNLSIGQGEILVTPLEVAYLTLLIAKGSAPPPQLIKSVGGHKIPPAPPRSIPFSSEELDVARRGMLLVVEGKEGTGWRARVEGVKVAGKTGTAQNVHGKDHSLFTCFAPFDDPEIVLTVFVENSGHGSEVAAPLAGEILKWYFENRRDRIAGAK